MFSSQNDIKMFCTSNYGTKIFLAFSFNPNLGYRNQARLFSGYLPGLFFFVILLRMGFEKTHNSYGVFRYQVITVLLVLNDFFKKNDKLRNYYLFFSIFFAFRSISSLRKFSLLILFDYNFASFSILYLYQ